MVSWAHQGTRGKAWGHGVFSKNMAGDCPLTLQWVRVRMADWGVGSPTQWDFFTFFGKQNLTESWTQREFLDGSVESLWFTLLMETCNSVAHVNLNLQTQICTNTFSLFSMNYLNMDLESLSHQGGSKFDLTHSCQESWFWDPFVLWEVESLIFLVSLVPSGLLLGFIQATHGGGTVSKAWAPGPQNSSASCSMWMIPLRACYTPKTKTDGQ